jgi:prevent-host-death family protein
MNWQLAEAKNKFSDLIHRALTEGPQKITRRGVETAVVLSAEEYQRLIGGRPSFKEYLMQGPSFEELDLERDQSPGRAVEL